MSRASRYPGLAQVKQRAKWRLPHFVWEYLDSGTGVDIARDRNRTALDQVLFRPEILHGEFTPDLSTSFLGRDFAMPFGVAPVGMSGLIWPEAEVLLARASARAGIPYTLSTSAAETPETVGRAAGEDAWFQLYPPRDPDVRTDILNRARDAGFTTLILTADVPMGSRRERQTASGLGHPTSLTPRIAMQCALTPVWSIHRLMHGTPWMKTLDPYVAGLSGNNPTAHVGYQMRTNPDWDYLRALRDAWDGPFHVKGVLRAEDAEALEAAGVDALWVSNHAGRQFDGAPAALDVLPAIRAATGLPLIVDGGVEGGLDILRMLALGADFVMVGRAFHYALGAFGRDGPDHLIDMFRKDMIANMGQIGARTVLDLAPRLYHAT